MRLIQKMASKFVDVQGKTAILRQGVSQLIKKHSRNYIEQKPKKVTTKGRGHRNVTYPNGNKIRAKFAREPFRKFSKIFNHVSYNCKGSSINKNKLENAIQNGCKMIVVGYENGEIYQYPAKMYKKWAEKHNTIRTTKYQDQAETTYSIPLDLMQQLR